VNEIDGLPLALDLLPEVVGFEGDAILVLVKPGLYTKLM